MKILIVTPYFWPEQVGAGVSMGELATFLHDQGHSVQVITGLPNYPSGKVASEYADQTSMVEDWNGVKVIRERSKYAGREDSVITKGLAALSFYFAAKRAARNAEPTEVIFTISPPPFALLASSSIGRKWGSKVYVRVTDLGWLALRSVSGVSQVIGSMFKLIEVSALKRAHRIGPNSPAFLSPLKEVGLKVGEPDVIADWVDGRALSPISDEESRKAEWGLDGKFLVMYSGSLGYSSDLAPMIHAAKTLESETRTAFLIIGAGPKEAEYKALAAEHGVANLQFLPFQPREVLRETLGSADVHIVSLTQEAAHSSTQGKSRSIMATGRPMIGIMPTDCAEAKLLTENSVGWVIDNQNVEGLVDLIRVLGQDSEQLRSGGIRARELYEQSFALETGCAAVLKSLGYMA
jgi:colanic acid biosynthesis glycosyl transferase WcaI